jgi:serine/threonine protein kinase
MGTVQGNNNIASGPLQPSAFPITPSKQHLLDLNLKFEALCSRFEKISLGAVIGFFTGTGVALGGLAVTNAALAFSGATLTGTAIFTGGLSLVGLAAITFLISVCVFLYKKRKNIQDLFTTKFQFNVPEAEFMNYQRNEDLEAIHKALGITDEITQATKISFEKKHGRSLDEVVDAAARAVASVRFRKKTNVYGSLRLGSVYDPYWKGKGKWKYLVTIDEQSQQISKLFIAKQTAYGSFTKVATTLTNFALLISRKRKGEIDRTERDQEKACGNIQHLHDFFKASQSRNYEEIKKYLPPLPEKVESIKLDGGVRPIRVVPEAISAGAIFKNEPKNGDVQEIIKRLKILRDVAFGVELMHEANMIHGDLKPENMLVDLTPEETARPHDFGGVCIIKDTDSLEEALNKIDHIAFTDLYTCYADVQHLAKFKTGFNFFIQTKEDLVTYGRAKDVYDLGLCTVQALVGKKHPFPIGAYVKNAKGQLFPNAEASQRTPIDCIPKNSPAGGKLHAFLDNALDKNFRKRMSEKDFVKALDEIIAKLEETLKNDR